MTDSYLSFERRAHPRCKELLPVLVEDPADALEDPYPAQIVDRSEGGVRLNVGRIDIEEGTILGLRPPRYPVDRSLVEVRVVNRRWLGDKLELGCAFVGAFSWNWWKEYSCAG
ncbi:MAG: hypothetical protein KatS3mg105_1216 [Gemmatales bacterium]|nr:MAG: hypothetical protein KatS3mg105_1216 [Gemmatales bacterium]